MITKWVTIRKLSELIGYSEDAIRTKIKRGIWVYKTHWRKAPDGRILLCLPAIETWIES